MTTKRQNGISDGKPELESEPQRKTKTQPRAWFSCGGVARGAMRDSQTRRSHASCAVRYLRGQVVGAIEIMALSEEMIPRRLRFNIAPHLRNADQAKTTFSLWRLDLVADCLIVCLFHGAPFGG